MFLTNSLIFLHVSYIQFVIRQAHHSSCNRLNTHHVSMIRYEKSNLLGFGIFTILSFFEQPPDVFSYNIKLEIDGHTQIELAEISVIVGVRNNGHGKFSFPGIKAG